MSTNNSLPVCKVMCPTCPFRPGSKYAHLAPDLALSALTEATRICHSTGSNNAINRRTGKPPAVCRGARDIQLRRFASSGFIEAPTDEAWDKKCAELQITPNSKSKSSSPRTFKRHDSTKLRRRE